MKNILSWVSILFSLIALTLSVFLFTGKKEIVYVDSMKLFANYEGSQVAKQAYEKKTAVWRSNIDTLTGEFNRELLKYKENKKNMSERERKLSEELVHARQDKLETYKQATLENASKEDKQITTKVFGEINDFLKKYGEEKGYEFIMAATNMGNIVYSKKENNVTDEVLEALNSDYRKENK